MTEKSASQADPEHGKEVPARQNTDHDEARAAVQRLRARAEQDKPGRFDWTEWKTYRDEGSR